MSGDGSHLPRRSIFLRADLGFEFNPQFTDANAACMIVSDKAFVMLLVQPFFQTFTRKAVCDTATHVEALIALAADSRAAVDELVERALAAGGSRAGEPVDHGFMYFATFHDLDGHHWEILWMDPKAVHGC